MSMTPTPNHIDAIIRTQGAKCVLAAAQDVGAEIAAAGIGV